MWTIVTSVAKRYILHLTVLVIAVGSLLGYGSMKRRQGVREKLSKDREAIADAVEEKRVQERRIRDLPISIDDRRKRVRAQRDKLRELL